MNFEHAFHFRYYIGDSHDMVNPESVSCLAVRLAVHLAVHLAYLAVQ